jgi:hypothetical protein
MMKIEFIPTNDFAKNNLQTFQPASRHVPEWYRTMPKHRFGETKYGIALDDNNISNATLKGCMPFLDSLTHGYMAVAPVDFELRKNFDSSFSIRWRTDGDFVSSHDQSQYPNMPAPHGMDNNVAVQWNSYFIIKTPPGYSTMFTHPMNRHDLPFRTFSGIVDTDVYPFPVLLPFQITQDIEINDFIIIEQGTPLYQFYPIKRESWSSASGKISPKELERKTFDFRAKIKNPHKSKYWFKKSFS